MPLLNEMTMGKLKLLDERLMADLNILGSSKPKRLEFYPDTIPYRRHITTTEYAAIWESLNNEKNGYYFYTSGYQVKRVGYFRKAWESIRGFFGFENHCNAARVKMTLQKLAYFGYLNNYDQEPLLKNSSWRKQQYHLSNAFIINAIQKRSNETSEVLQAQLMSYFNDNSLQLEPGYWHQLFSEIENLFLGLPDEYQPFPDPNSTTFKFGDTFSTRTALQKYVINLDPQNKEIVDRLVNLMVNDESLHNPIVNSTLAYALADRLVDDYSKGDTLLNYLKSFVGLKNKATMPAPILRAAKIDTSLETRRKDFYIKFYAESNMLNKAVKLLITLENTTKAVEIINHYKIDIKILEAHIEKDTPLGIALAQFYMQNINQNKYNPNSSAVDNAMKFASLTRLHRDYPRYFLLRYVEQGAIDKAYEIFCSQSNKTLFDRNALNRLAYFYHQQATALLDESNEHIQKKRWEEAKQSLKQSKLSKKIASEVQPDNNEYKDDVIMHGFHSGRLIVLSPIYGDQRANRLDQAIKKISLAYNDSIDDHDNEKDKVKNMLLKALHERAQIALQACFVDIDCNKGVMANQEHKDKSLAHVKKAIECFKSIIDLNSKGGHRLLTAEAHFMIADLQDYFGLAKNTQDFNRAMELAPHNPFYALTCHWVFSDNTDETREKGFTLLQAHNLKTNDYSNWREERWLKPEKRTSGINNIHLYSEQRKPEKKGWFSFLTG